MEGLSTASQKNGPVGSLTEPFQIKKRKKQRRQYVRLVVVCRTVHYGKLLIRKRLPNKRAGIFFKKQRQSYIRSVHTTKPKKQKQLATIPAEDKRITGQLRI